MNPENTFTPTPLMSSASYNTLPSGSFFVNKVDFYQPNISMPNTLDTANIGPALDPEDLIKSSFDNKAKEIQGKAYNRFSMMDNPLKTPLSQTLRYQDAKLGGYNYDDPNQEYKYGENQNWLDSVTSRSMQFAGNAAASFLGSFSDIPSLISAGIDYKDSSKNGLDRAMDAYKGLFDNTMNNNLDEFNKSILDSNLTYDTRFSESSPFLSGKIFGDIIASAGFSVGSMAGMLAEDSLITLATGGIAVAPVLGAQVAKLGAKFIKVLNGGDNALNTLKGALKAGMDTSKALDAAYQVSKIQKAAYGLNMYTNNIFESSIEAKESQESTEQNLVREYQLKNGSNPTGDDLVNIKKVANDSANMTFFGNMLLLGATNKLEFGDIISRMQVGKEAFDFTEKGLARIVADGGIDNLKVANAVAQEAVIPATKYGKMIAAIRKGTQDLGGFTKSSLGEGIEEGGQFTIGTATEDYYTQKYNAKGLESANSWYKSLGKALGETFSTKEGWMNIIAGIGGGIVMGGARKALGLDPANKEIDRDALIGQLTSTQLSNIVYGMGAKINEHINAVGVNAKQDVVKDWYSLQQNQHAQVFNWTLAALKGQNDYLSIREEQLRTAKQLEGNDFKNMFGVEDNEVNRKSVHSYLDNILEDTKTIKENYDRVSSVYKNPYGYAKDPKPEDIEKYIKYENYKDELIYHLSKQKNNQRLVDNLESTIESIHPFVEKNLVMDLATKSGLELKDSDRFNPQFIHKKGVNEGVMKVRQQLLENQKQSTDLVNTGVASDKDKVRKALADKFVERANEVIEAWDKEPLKTVEFFKDLYNELTKDSGADKLTNTDTQQLMALGAERAKVKASTERSLKIFDLLGTKKGFEKFLDMELSAGNRFMKQQAVERENTSDPTEEDQEIITDEIYRAFQKTHKLPQENQDDILSHIASKILNKVKLTDREAKVYAKFKTDIDALNKTEDPEETKDPDINSDPIVDVETGLKEGDVIKSVRTKESLIIKTIKPKSVLLQKEDGSMLTWTLDKFHLQIGIEEYTVTGETVTKYTKEDWEALQRTYDHVFLKEFGLKHGGWRYANQNDDSESLGDLFVIPSDMKGKDKETGEFVKPIVLTRRGIKALIDYQKTGKDDSTKQDWIYAGRERDPNDKRSIADILAQYEADPDTNQLDLNVALKNMINSPWATDSEVELARYLIQYVPVGTKVAITKDQTSLSSTNGMSIGLDSLEDSPIEVILVHETLHLLTWKALRDNKEFRDKVEELRLRARDIAVQENKTKTFRGLEENDNSLDEFITEALTNQEFIKFLGSAKSTSSNTATSKTIWKSFIDAIQKLFNINTDQTLLEYVSDLVFTEIDKVNTRKADSGQNIGMVFDPNTTFSKVATRGQIVNPNIISLRNQGNLTPEYVLKNGSFKLDTPRDNVGNPQTLPEGWTKYSYPDTNGQQVKFDNLFKSTPKRIIEVHVDGKNIGMFQPISTWSFQRNGVFLSLTELTQGEYYDVTKNNVATYDQFMETIRAHAQLESMLLAKSNGEEVNFSTLTNNMLLTITSGPLAVITNEAKRPDVSALVDAFPEFKGTKTPFIISLSVAYNPKTDAWEDRPIGYLTTIPANTKVYNLIKTVVEKNYDKLKGLNSRYLTVVSTTGKWESEDDLDFVIAHPKEMKAADKTKLLETIIDTLNRNQTGTEGIDNFYIADSSTGKRELSLVVKDGQLFFSSKNANSSKGNYSRPLYLKDIEGKTFDEFIQAINTHIDPKKIKPILAKDFKINIEDDATVSPDTLITQLSAVTTTVIRNPVVSIKGKLNMINPRANEANSIGKDTEVPITKPKEVKDLSEEELLALANQYEEDDEDEEVDVTPIAPVKAAAGPSVKAQAIANGRKKGLKYELMTPTKALIEEYKRTCGS